MNKLKYLLFIIPFLFIGSVKANELEIIHSNSVNTTNSLFYSDFNYIKNLGYDDIIQKIYNMLLEEYNVNYSSDYPYFHVEIVVRDKESLFSTDTITDELSYIYGYLNFYSEVPVFLDSYLHSSNVITSSYNFDTTTYYTPTIISSYVYPPLINNNKYNPMAYFISNYDLINGTTYTYKITGNSNFTINPGDIIKPYFSADTAFQNNYVEVNLNDYAYVALSLKDYNKEPFTSRQYVKGEYCVSGAYDYGLSSKEKYDSSVTDICTPYYDVFTPVDHYVLENDLKYHAIYYLKARDTSKENKIRVDSSIFNIHYITEEEADNPVININGRNYSILPFDELPSNSIKNTEEGFVPGASEKFSFSDIFTAPLEFLKDVWNSIVNVFDLIIEFIYLLPKELQGFLIASFYLAVAIGLLKILL